MPSHLMEHMDTYGGERGECGLIITVFKFLDAFLEFHTPNLCHFCDGHGRGSELTRPCLAGPKQRVYSRIM